jgi:hypothetical protein
VKVRIISHHPPLKKVTQQITLWGLSWNPRKFRETKFRLFLGETFHHWREKRKVFDINHAQIRAE